MKNLKQQWQDFKTRQDGGIMIYLMVALALGGLLIVTVSQGSRQHASARKVSETQNFIEGDVVTIESAISECILSYSKAVDVDDDGDVDSDDNPNVPFPVYDDLSTGGAGEDLVDIKCPGQPGMPKIFGNDPSRHLNVLNDAEYTLTYFSDATEGVKLTIARNADDPVWVEAKTRIDTAATDCKMEINTTSVAPDCTGGGGCLVYWFKLRSTATTHSEAGCP